MKLKGLTAMLLLLPAIVFSQSVSKDITPQDSADKEINKENDVLELSLNDAIYRALKNNLGLKSDGFNFDKTKWSLYGCWNTFLPTITGSGTFSINTLDEDDRKGSQWVGAVPSATIPGGYDTVMNYEYTTPQVMPTLAIKVNWNFNAAMIFQPHLR